jgi:hypothetical protein
MKCSIVLSVLLMGQAVVQAQAGAPEAIVRQQFPSGGTVRLHLESGGYEIIPSDSDTIVVTYQTRSPERLKEVKVTIKASQERADLYVTNTPNNNFTATIEIPRQSNLWVRLTAGELNVGSLVGDKDLELRAGRLQVEIPRPQEYGHRDASVTTGSIEARAFEVSTGGLFRSFHQQGPGKYRLHAHVMAGEIDLRGTI